MRLALGHGLVALAAAWLVACGSQRLDTALEPAVSGGSGGVAGFGGSASPSAGAGGDPEPLRTEPLISLADFDSGYPVGPLSLEPFQLSGQVFTEAWRTQMAEPPADPWTGQLVMPLNKRVSAQQLLHVSFWLKCEAPRDSGDCYTEYIFERASEPWEKSVVFTAHAGPNWTENSQYFSSAAGYGVGEAHMVFRLGYAVQVLAIGGLQLEAIGSQP
jgi:hypothetical protein